MKIEIKNCCYWVEIENNKVYNMVNGEINEQLRVQEKINHVINIAKRIQRIRKIYKSKKIQHGFYKVDSVTEWCPYCDTEVGLEMKFIKQICPSCKTEILPCAQCEDKNCSQCPL